MAKTALRPVDEGEVLVITRVFDAPRARVFRAWTDPAEGMRWMGPRDHPVVHMEGEVRPGGAWRACLRSIESGKDLWQGGVYREVAPPERLVFTFAWDAGDGRPGREMLVSVSFAEQAGKTTMTFRQEGLDSVESRDGHREGWNSTFDRLEELLAEEKPADARGAGWSLWSF